MWKQLLKGKLASKLMSLGRRRKGVGLGGLLGMLGWRNRRRLKRLLGR